MFVRKKFFEQLVGTFGAVAKALFADHSKPYVAGRKIETVDSAPSASADPHPVTDRDAHRKELAKKGVGANVPFDII